MQPFGACRPVLVEQKGGKVVASCHYARALKGASTRQRSPLLSRLRYNIAELIVSDHPLECLDCTANNRCELQSFAAEVGLRTPRFENRAYSQPAGGRLASLHQAGDGQVHRLRALRARLRRGAGLLHPRHGRPRLRHARHRGQRHGFREGRLRELRAVRVRMPVAALEESQTRVHGLPDATIGTTCSYCGVGCSLNVNVKDGTIINIEPNTEGSANLGHACVKGRFAHQFGYSDDRLRKPLIRDGEPGQFPRGELG
jgi:formate dehydrogenase major subunit